MKTPSWKSSFQRHSGLIKRYGVEAQALKAWFQNCLMKGENVLRERISVINLNCYKIKTFFSFFHNFLLHVKDAFVEDKI